MRGDVGSQSFTPFVTPKVSVHGLNATAEFADYSALPALFKEVEKAVTVEIEKHLADERYTKEMAQQERDKPKQRPGLKTLAKADAAKRQSS